MAKKKSKVGSKLGFTARQIGTMKSMSSRGISRSKIAEKFGITAKTLSNLLYAAGWKRSEHKPKTYLEQNVFGYTAQSGRTDRLTYNVQAMTYLDFNELSPRRQKELITQMQKRIQKDLKELEKAGYKNTAAQEQVKKNKEWYEKKQYDVDPYTGKYNEKYATEMFETLRRYLVTYKTGYLKGQQQVQKATEERITSGIPAPLRNTYKNMSEDSKAKFWEWYRDNVENNQNLQNAFGYVKEQKQYIYGSDLIQQVVYQEMTAPVYDKEQTTEQDLRDYIWTLAERAYEGYSRYITGQQTWEKYEDAMDKAQKEYRRRLEKGENVSIKELTLKYMREHDGV